MKIDLNQYFTNPEGSIELRLEELNPTRIRPEGVENAEQRMDLAATGDYPKRDPITVRRRADGRWDIEDGNSTYAVAKARQWSSIRCVVTES